MLVQAPIIASRTAQSRQIGVSKRVVRFPAQLVQQICELGEPRRSGVNHEKAAGVEESPARTHSSPGHITSVKVTFWFGGHVKQNEKTTLRYEYVLKASSLECQIKAIQNYIN